MGRIRVGRILYQGGKPNYPSYEDYEFILVLTKSSKYGSLGPYVLTATINGVEMIIENLWQFAKVYEEVPDSTQYYSRFDRTVIWKHKAETHVGDEVPNRKYWRWRRKGFECEYPVRYPVGMKSRHKCLYSIPPDQDENFTDKLNYIEARKKIYLKYYVEAVKNEPQFKQLRRKYKEGGRLLIVEVDGPHQESMSYYQKKYDVPDDWITENSIRVNSENMKIMLNDPKHPFGHGYCLAMAIMGLDKFDID